MYIVYVTLGMDIVVNLPGSHSLPCHAGHVRRVACETPLKSVAVEIDP